MKNQKLRLLAFTVFSGLSLVSVAQRNTYAVDVDLTKRINDELTVNIITPKVGTDVIEYQMPKMVPGTYAVYDFGRFVKNFEASDSLGNKLGVKRIDDNRWEISGAKKLYRISYTSEDTYDTDKDNKIFEPGGTSYDANVFVLNNYSYIGYLKGMQKVTYNVHFTKPTGFFGATALTTVKSTVKEDVFSAPDYFELHDNPILYCEADTANIPVGNAMVTVAVYSPNKLLKADLVRENLRATLDAQRKYLGGTLPVDRYAILIYLTDKQTMSGGYGALEHSYSTLLVLPEQNPEALAQSVRDVTAHEFFHIITPLSIHSEQVHDYNFIDPQMSQHLWLYEGVTEYSAQHVQVKYNLFTHEQFFSEMRNKIIGSLGFKDDLAFTEMSKGALDKYEDQYTNVYQKGALIGMCLDLLLLEKSNGVYGIQALMQDLAKKYGKHKAFADKDLFSIITEMTYPEVGEFLNKYVGGGARLPFKEYLGFAGVNYQASVEKMEPSLGVLLARDLEGNISVMGASTATQLGKDLKLKDGDIIESIQGEEVNMATAQAIFDNLKANTKEGDKLEIVVKRGGKSKKLKAKASLSAKEYKHVITELENPTAEQAKIRKAWLQGE